MSEVFYETKTEGDIISSSTVQLLLNIGRWTRFIAITGFVFLGLAFLALISSGLIISGTNYYAEMTHDIQYTPGVFSWGYALGTFLYLLVLFFPVWYLYQFSRRINKAFVPGSTITFHDAVFSLKQHFTFVGALIALWLIMIIMGIIFMIVTLFI